MSSDPRHPRPKPLLCAPLIRAWTEEPQVLDDGCLRVLGMVKAREEDMCNLPIALRLGIQVPSQRSQSKHI